VGKGCRGDGGEIEWMYNVRLLVIGIMNPPIQWIYANKNEGKKREKNREIQNHNDGLFNTHSQ
jgi:hypothetical protein